MLQAMVGDRGSPLAFPLSYRVLNAALGAPPRTRHFVGSPRQGRWTLVSGSRHDLDRIWKIAPIRARLIK
jgi:hypothetical protein